MDVISFGVANKAGKNEKNTRENILGLGVQGSYSHIKDRIDALESSIEGVNKMANKLIINDAINIMKANAKLNAVAKTIRYKHQNMVFEDFLDASGIDTSKSSGYTLDTSNGLVKANGANPYTIVTTQELADTVPTSAILVVEELSSSGSDIIPKMTGDSTPAPYKVTQSNYYNYGYGWKVFDDDPSTSWWADNGGTGWVKIDLGAGNEKAVDGYKVVQTATGKFLDYSLQGSNDNTNWTTLHSVTNSIGGTETFQFQNNTAYRYYRFFGSRKSALSAFLNELELYVLNSTSTLLGTYSISRDDGATWEPITPETLFYFTAKSPSDKKLRLKAELPPNVQLLSYGLTWS
jgi:hypothetical protein